MKSKSTIEVNGNRYDAVTGAVLGPATAPTIQSRGRNIDGFFRPRAATAVTKTPQPVSGSIAALAATPPSAPELRPAGQGSTRRTVNHTRAHTPQAAGLRTVHVSHSSGETHQLAIRREPNHMHHHAAQHSLTLRRDSVPAPQPSTHNLLKPKGTLQHETPGAISLKKAADSIDPERLARAQSASKSTLVARHAAPQTGVLPTFAPLNVQPTPVAAPPQNGIPLRDGPEPSKDIFEQALANADHFVDIRAHRTAYRKKVHTHVASMLTGSLALIVIAAFVAYQNNPGVQFKVASVRAGISAHLPNFAAAGFSYDGARAGDGRLVVGFKNGAGTYQLTQAVTNFSDADMIQAIGATDASGTPTYSVVQAGGVNVYRFGNTNATWVSGGKWYTVNGTGALTNSQIKTLIQQI